MLCVVLFWSIGTEEQVGTFVRRTVIAAALQYASNRMQDNELIVATEQITMDGLALEDAPERI